MPNPSSKTRIFDWSMSSFRFAVPIFGAAAIMRPAQDYSRRITVRFYRAAAVKLVGADPQCTEFLGMVLADNQRGERSRMCAATTPMDSHSTIR